MTAASARSSTGIRFVLATVPRSRPGWRVLHSIDWPGPLRKCEPGIILNGFHALIDSQGVENSDPFVSRIPHGVEGKCAVTEGFHPSKLCLKRGRESVRTWAGVGREEVEVIPEPFRPDVGDVVELLALLRRLDVLGLQDVLDQVPGLRFYLGFERGGYGGCFLAGRIFHGSLGFAIVIIRPCSLLLFQVPFARLQHLRQRLRIGQPVFMSRPRSATPRASRCSGPVPAESANGTTSSASECRMTVPGLTVVAVPHRFHAGQSRTNGVEPVLMFIATAPPRLEPTTTSG